MREILSVILLLLLGDSHCMTTHRDVQYYDGFHTLERGLGNFEEMPIEEEFMGDSFINLDTSFHVMDPPLTPLNRSPRVALPALRRANENPAPRPSIATKNLQHGNSPTTSSTTAKDCNTPTEGTSQNKNDALSHGGPETRSQARLLHENQPRRTNKPVGQRRKPDVPQNFDALPPVYQNGLSNLLKLLSKHEAGRQILIKLDILERQPVTRTRQSRERMALTPRKADRLLRLLSGLKTSDSGKDLLYQLNLGEFMKLPKMPLKLDSPVRGVSNFDVPRTLDFSAYDYDARGTCVDEVMGRTVSRYHRPSVIDELFGRTPGYLTTEMDMVLTRQQWRDFYGNLPLPRSRRGRLPMNRPHMRQKRKAIKHQRYYWPDRTVPYILDDNEFNWSDVMLFERAMYEWEQATCVHFKLATPSDVNKIRFRNGQGCSSHVGMIGGTQNITLQGPCRIRRIVLHEIGHSLGLVHEHQRPDRDNFIQILYENARPGTEWDFKKRTWGTVVNHTVGYDYMSVMHYGPKAFSMDRNKPTIIARNSQFQDTIGKVTELSFDDKKLVNMMYKCGEHCPDTVQCQHGGYVNKDCKCACPSNHPNCQVVIRKPTFNENKERAQPDFSWMSLFQAFSWNAINALGFPSNILGQQHSPTHSAHLMEAYDSPIPTKQQSSVVPLGRQPMNTNQRRRMQPQVHIQHMFHRRIKRDIEEKKRKKRAFSFRAIPRVRTGTSLSRRRLGFTRRRPSRHNKLPRLSRKYFQSISSTDREARMKEIRYNNRRRKYEKENRRSRSFYY